MPEFSEEYLRDREDFARDGRIPYATLIVGANSVDIEIVVVNHNEEQVFCMVMEHEEGRLLAYTLARLINIVIMFQYATVVVCPMISKSVCWKAKFYHKRTGHERRNRS